MAGKCRYYWNMWSSGVALNHMKTESESVASEQKEKLPVVYVIVPGNPGCIQFYERFAEELFSLTKIPVWGVSHTGHVHCDDTTGFEHPSIVDCGLEKQIQHKIEYLRQEVLPRVEKVILIGHSIGCYIILQIMNRMPEESSSICKGILLFPTIEKMRQTPRGKSFTPLVSNARWFLTFLVGVLRSLPITWLNYLVGVIVKSNEPCIQRTVIEHFTTSVTDCSTYMALQEMYEVNDRDDDIIESNLDKLIFYYGATDGWCPTSYYEDVLKTHGLRPGSNIQLCSKGYPHAFVMNSSAEVATLVAEWTRSTIC